MIYHNLTNHDPNPNPNPTCVYLPTYMYLAKLLAIVTYTIVYIASPAVLYFVGMGGGGGCRDVGSVALENVIQLPNHCI